MGVLPLQQNIEVQEVAEVLDPLEVGLDCHLLHLGVQDLAQVGPIVNNER